MFLQLDSTLNMFSLLCSRSLINTGDQLHVFDMELVYDCEKLQVVFDVKVKEVGEVTTANMLLYKLSFHSSEQLKELQTRSVTHHHLGLESKLYS